MQRGRSPRPGAAGAQGQEEAGRNLGPPSSWAPLPRFPRLGCAPCENKLLLFSSLSVGSHARRPLWGLTQGRGKNVDSWAGPHSQPWGVRSQHFPLVKPAACPHPRSPRQLQCFLPPRLPAEGPVSWEPPPRCTLVPWETCPTPGGGVVLSLRSPLRDRDGSAGACGTGCVSPEPRGGGGGGTGSGSRQPGACACPTAWLPSPSRAASPPPILLEASPGRRPPAVSGDSQTRPRAGCASAAGAAPLGQFWAETNDFG